MRTAAFLLILTLLSCRISAAGDVKIPDLTGTPEISTETRVTSDGDGVLISRDKIILAAIRVRVSAPDSADAPVLSPDAARALLAEKRVGREHVVEQRFPLEGATLPAKLNVLKQTRPVSQGARMLFTSQISPAKSTGNFQLPPLEIAVQIFPGADGSALKLTYLDNAPADEKTSNAAELRARALTFEIPKKQRVTLERSASATWTVRKSGSSTILTARFARDPHAPEKYGSFVLFAGSAHDEDSPEISVVTLNKTQLPARDFIEGHARVYASGANPYLLQEIAVVAEIALPPRVDGSVPTKLLPCYFRESADPSKEEGEFRFRFAPPSEGLYGVRLYVSTPAAKCESDTQAFRAGVPASPGIVRVRKGERVFRLDDGTIHTPVGIDLSRFGVNDGLEKFQQSIVELHRCGGNTIALSLSRLLPLEGPEAGRINPQAAEMLDQIFLFAQARGVGIILSLENGADIGRDSTRHPYFREMGGPLIAQPEYFRDPTAKRFYQVRITYAAARYSAFRSLMSWDLMRSLDEAWPALKKDPEDKSQGLAPREVDLSRRLRRDVEDWVEQMAQQLRGLDQHGHPICISTSLDPDKGWHELQASEHIEWAASRDFNEGGPRTAEERFPAFNPVFGRWAADARGPKRPRKPWGILALGLKQNSPSAQLACICAGLPMTPLIPVEPGAAFSESERVALRSASIFGAALADISAFDPRDELQTVSDDKGGVKMFGRAGKRGAAVWILNPGGTATKGVEFKLPGLLEGNYTITWMDPRTGLILSSAPHSAPAQQVNKPIEPCILRVPPFDGEITAFVVRDLVR